jgi:hypothetical protein
MSITTREILASLAAIEARAPAYFGDMPIADDDARELFASAMATLSASPEFASAAPASREACLLATLTHVMLESAYLRHRLHANGAAASVEAGSLLAKLTAR